MSDAGSSKRLVVKEFEILNQYGIHARPAALFVKTASRYDSDVWVVKDDNKVSGKSIMGMMTLEAAFGSKIRVIIEGADSVEAMAALETLILNKFYED